jgi:hypothetical protein
MKLTALQPAFDPDGDVAAAVAVSVADDAGPAEAIVEFEVGVVPAAPEPEERARVDVVP